LDNLIDVYGLPLFIKIDVEGYEVNVLRGLRRPVPFISFEVNLSEFRAEGLECVELLERLAPRGGFNFATDCRLGFSMNCWLQRAEFAEALSNCSDNCVEVFWAAPRV